MAKKKSSPQKKNELSTEIFHKNDHIIDNQQGESCCQVKNFKLITDLIPNLNSFCYPIEMGKTLNTEIKRFKNILIYEDYMKGECEHFEGYLSEDTEYEHTCENNNEKIGDLPIEELLKVHQMICEGTMNPTKLTSYQYFKVMMYMKEKQPKVKVGPKSFKEKMNRKAVRKSPRGKTEETNETETEEPVRYNLRQTRNSKRASQDLNEIDDSVLTFTRKKRKKLDKTKEKPKEPAPETKEITPPEPETPVREVKTAPIPDSPESPDNQIQISPELPDISPKSPETQEIPASKVSPVKIDQPEIEPQEIPASKVSSPVKIDKLIQPEIKSQEIPASEVSSPVKIDKLIQPEIKSQEIPASKMSSPVKIDKLFKPIPTKDDEKENVSDDEKIPETPPLVRRLASRDPRLQKRIEEQRIFEDKKSVADKIIENYRKEKIIKEQFDRLERQKLELKRKEEELKRKLEEDIKLREEEQKKKKKKVLDMELIYKTPLSDLHSEEKISYNNHKPRTEDFSNKHHEEKPKYYSNISYSSHTEHLQTLHQQIHFHIHSKVPEYQYEFQKEDDEQPVHNRNRYYSKPFRRRYEDFHRRDRYRKPQERRYSDQFFRRRNKDDRRY